MIEPAKLFQLSGGQKRRKLALTFGALERAHGVNIGGMSRDGKSMLVSGATQMREGDKVVVFCLDNTLRKLDKFFR